MNHQLSADFLIVGAGAAGLSLAGEFCQIARVVVQTSLGAAALSRDLMAAGNRYGTLASLVPLVSPARFFTQGANP